MSDSGDLKVPIKTGDAGPAPVQLKPAGATDAPVFAVKSERGGVSISAWVVAGLLLVAVAVVILLSARKPPAATPAGLQPVDSYAASLQLSDFAMSEAENLSGGKLTYLDGRIGNTGGRVVTGITVQAVFQNDEAMPPQIVSLPLTLIRTRQPYIDVEPVSSDPLRPGDSREFRLTFETVAENWNTQMPVVRVIRVDTK